MTVTHTKNMGYYNYHAKIKQKIKDGELVRFEFVDNYKNYSPCLVLYFSDGKVYPIKEYMFDEYLKLLDIKD